MHNELTEKPNLLLVDDDPVLCEALRKALARRGFEVVTAHSADEGYASAQQINPEYAVVDLKMPGESGLRLVERLHALDINTPIVVLTGYASIATAIEAIKLGATHYLAKPANADEIVAALHKNKGNAELIPAQFPTPIARIEWEHIQKTLRECEGNISETARRLGMHRRTLQRKLSKKPSPERERIN